MSDILNLMQCSTHLNQWQRYHSFLRNRIPSEYITWLLDKNSLTARLQKLSSPNGFKVKVLAEHNSYANLQDAKALGIKPGIRLRVREVHLVCDGIAVVYARSLIPVTSVVGRFRRLSFQGSKSLGAALFADPSVKRSPIQITVTKAADIPQATIATDTDIIWGRRSLFHVMDLPLLVSEYYLPSLKSLK